jgi:hypothetical protein
VADGVDQDSGFASSLSVHFGVRIRNDRFHRMASGPQMDGSSLAAAAVDWHRGLSNMRGHFDLAPVQERDKSWI